MLRQAHRGGRLTLQPGGFTLLELLVTVSVVALLLAILSPSLESARKQAKRVVCGSRLKQWGMAFGCYATEHDGSLPHCDGLDRGPRDVNHPRISQEDLADWHGWVDVLPPVIDLKAWRDHSRHEYPDERTFYQCPLGQPLEQEGAYSYRPFRDGYFSYAMNSCLELDANSWPPPGGIGYPMSSFLDSGKIECPQRVILLFDQLLDPRKGFDAQTPYRGAGKYCGSYPKAFSARHPRNRSELGGNILYADGHTDWEKSVWKDDWDPDQEVPPRDDLNWYPYSVRCTEKKP